MVYGFSNFGYEGALIEVECSIREGEEFDIVGMADGQIMETKERIKTTIDTVKKFPKGKVLVSLTPSDMYKDGVSFDLPISLAILLESKQIKSSGDVLVMGWLDKDKVNPVKGTFGACQNAIKNGIKYAILPKGSQVPEGIKVCLVSTMTEAINALEALDTNCKEKTSEPSSNNIEFEDVSEYSLDDTENQNDLKFAMAVAVAGKHNLMTFGNCVGDGRTWLLEGMREILPKLDSNERQIATRIFSNIGLVKPNENYITRRPFRMPHFTATIEGMCGGGVHCNAGEISIANNGVLFLDEASEFRTSVLQMLRVPLENGRITLSRAGRQTVYPADFQLVMTTQSCPCGNYGSKDRICLCSAKSIERYWKKFSDPLLDRVEIRFDCNSTEQLTTEKMTVERMRELITNAWTMQKKRGVFNGKGYREHIFTEEVNNWFSSGADWQKINRLPISERRRWNVITLARTLADMNCNEKISHSDFELAIKLNADTPLDWLGQI